MQRATQARQAGPLGRLACGRTAPSTHSSDLIWAMLTTLLFFASTFKILSFVTVSGLLLLCTAGPVSNLAAVWVIIKRPEGWARHRTPILAAVKLLRSLCLTLTLDPAWFLLNQASREGNQGVLRPLLAKTIFPMLQGLGFRLPLTVHLYIQALALALPFLQASRLCTYECATQSTRHFYAWLASSIGSALNKGALVLVATQPAGSTGQSGSVPGPEVPCTLVSMWLQIVVGYLLPTALIDWSEAQPPVWRVPEQGSGMRRLKLTKQPVYVAFHYLGLVAVAAVVSWNALELAFGVERA